MQEYFTVFIILIFFAFADLYFNERVRYCYFFIPFVFILAFIGFRDETGNDWTPYYDYFQWLNDLNYKSDSFELGFRFFSYSLKNLGFDYILYLFFVTFLYLVFFSISFFYTKRPSLMLFLFYSTYLLGFMGTMRQTIAISICLLSFVLYFYNRKIISTALIFVSSFFHVTAFFAFVSFVVPKKLISGRVFLFLVSISFFFFVFDIVNFLLEFFLSFFSGLDFIYNRLVTYSQIQSSDLYENGGVTLVLGSIKRVVFSFLFWFFLRRTKVDVPFIEYFFNLYFISVVLFLLFQGPLLMLALRGTLYFAFMEIFLIGAICLSFRGAVLKFLMFSFTVLYMYSRLYSSVYSYHPDLYIPYKAFFYNQEVKKNLY